MSVFAAVRERRAEVSVEGLSARRVDEAVEQAVKLAKLSEPADV